MLRLHGTKTKPGETKSKPDGTKSKFLGTKSKSTFFPLIRALCRLSAFSRIISAQKAFAGEARRSARVPFSRPGEEGTRRSPEGCQGAVTQGRRPAAKLSAFMDEAETDVLASMRSLMRSLIGSIPPTASRGSTARSNGDRSRRHLPQQRHHYVA